MTRTGHNRWLGLVTIEAWAQLVSVNRNLKKAKRWKVMKGDEGWKFPFQSQNPRVYRHFTRIDEGWRVFSWFLFLKLILSKCLLMAQMCPTWGTFVLFKEQFYCKGKYNMTNWAFAVLKNYRKLETTAFVKYLMFNFKFTKAVILTNWSFVSFSPHALNQRSPARSGIENRWPKGKAKVKGRSS